MCVKAGFLNTGQLTHNQQSNLFTVEEFAFLILHHEHVGNNRNRRKQQTIQLIRIHPENVQTFFYKTLDLYYSELDYLFFPQLITEVAVEWDISLFSHLCWESYTCAVPIKQLTRLRPHGSHWRCLLFKISFTSCSPSTEQVQSTVIPCQMTSFNHLWWKHTPRWTLLIFPPFQGQCCDMLKLRMFLSILFHLQAHNIQT